MKITTLFSHLFFLCLILSSCASAPIFNVKNVSNIQTLYLDDYFPGYSSIDIESEDDVFSLDDEMKEMVQTQLLGENDPYQRSKKLLTHIFSREHLDIAYQNSANLTATQTYHSQTANCMSLTIMSYALAEAAGLNVVFQEVKIPEYWVRNGQYSMLTGHVNLLIKRPSDHRVAFFWERSRGLEIDFDPSILKRSFPKEDIDKSTVLAMFYTNKGAQAMVDEDYLKAYSYFKRATLAAPKFASSWNNLAILYRMINNYTLAEKVYHYTLTIAPDNLTTVSNLAMLLEKQGAIDKARMLEKQIHEKRLKNPYYHALLGDEALYNGQIKQAKIHFKNAIKINNNIHEFYYGLAKVYYQLDEYILAEDTLKKAIKLNKSSTTDMQYVAKLNLIRSTELNE
ncbi:tetratricopeptide repeat protein [Thalassotalea profundi]|uniref:Tetratricopeptide repeat protein n=1 Tax=Thalassotalea profundi TaxID=2036687 RepID=A0ABQ3IG66_9GAMM|nr:tetratricopeptide repeat protein [Thalassotalea profundi]GHE82488.1 hypothetical protein GCM10011501_08400 [Thalassotalea profundi]